LLDFTGERVVPGLVDPNLFNEHLARYRFAAAQFGSGPVRVLDAGCGTGYGTAQFGPDATVIGIDVAGDALLHARDNFGRPGVCFVQAGCETLPFADSSFDLIVAFEVIEHIERWRDMLREAKRVLKPSGLFLVSTPNKTYYAESRRDAGPNPYHVHEFEYEEFAAALREVFPHAHLWSQNHSEAIAFVPLAPTGGVLDVPADADTVNAHFFVAACGSSAIPRTDAFAYLTATGNVLRERELHVALLEQEVAQKTTWLEEANRAHAVLKDAHDALIAELEQHNAWAAKLNAEIGRARGIIAGLEEELQSNNRRAAEAVGRLEEELAESHRRYSDQIRRLEEEAVARLNWAHDLERQIANGKGEIGRRLNELTKLREAFDERTQWGETKAQEALRACEIINWQKEQMTKLEQTGWVRLGRKLGIIPK
jgi:ubiquinone/menaquinone biosynthesis C-methylase UbiE